MKCHEAEYLLPSYAKGEEENIVLVERHLQSCENCRSQLAFIQQLRDDIAQFPQMSAEANFLGRLRQKIKVEQSSVENKPAESTTQVWAIPSKKASSRRTVASRRVNPLAELNFIDRWVELLKRKISSPAMLYALLLHLLVIGLSGMVYISHQQSKKSDFNKNDLSIIRMFAYKNVQKQNIVSKQLDVSTLITNGEVYVLSTSRCIRVLLDKPSANSNYRRIKVVNGKLALSDQEALAFFKSSQSASVLKFKRALEIWSTDDLDTYIREETPFFLS